MSNKPPFEPTEDGERQYVETQRERLAEAARKGLERFGRGVVLITVSHPDAPDKAGVVEYVGDADAQHVWPGRGWPEASTAERVREYDTEKSFLVMFLNYDTQTCRLHRFEHP